MGFPNVDLQLVAIFTNSFIAAQAAPAQVIADTFGDLDPTVQTQIAAYLTRKSFINDVREHGGSFVYIIPSFPLSDVPFPQIAISLGQGDSDRFIGDETGNSTPVLDGNGATIAWNVEKGYYEKSNWNIHIVCATKDEVIWLSRLCQRFICESFDALCTAGIMEVNIFIQDLRADENTMQPSTVFSRGIRMSATVANTWNIQIPLMADYEVGNNTAL